MRWINKITDKRAAYDLIERERPHKTLDELADDLLAKGYSQTRLHPTWIGKVCQQLNIKDKPRRIRGRAYAKLKQASTSLPNETSSVIKTLTI